MSVCNLLAGLMALVLVSGCADEPAAGGEKKNMVQETLAVPGQLFKGVDPLESGKKRDESIAAAAEKFAKFDMDRVNLMLADLHQAVAELSCKIAAVDVEAINKIAGEPALLRPPVEQVMLETTAALQDVRTKVQSLPIENTRAVVDNLDRSISLIGETRASLMLPIRLLTVLIGVLILCALAWFYRLMRTLRTPD